MEEARLNPLHCGAVVASLPTMAPERAKRLVSIPFIAGQWSLLRWGRGEGERSRLVSIPFIAGQWSLLPDWWIWDDDGAAGLNPLHCGAVVASR